jgi:hypothetical protein
MTAAGSRGAPQEMLRSRSIKGLRGLCIPVLRKDENTLLGTPRRRTEFHELNDAEAVSTSFHHTAHEQRPQHPQTRRPHFPRPVVSQSVMSTTHAIEPSRYYRLDAPTAIPWRWGSAVHVGRTRHYKQLRRPAAPAASTTTALPCALDRLP